MFFYSTKHLLTSIHKNYFNIFEGGQATINTDSHDNLCVRNNFPRITLRWHNTVLRLWNGKVLGAYQMVGF